MNDDGGCGDSRSPARVINRDEESHAVSRGRCGAEARKNVCIPMADRAWGEEQALEVRS